MVTKFVTFCANRGHIIPDDLIKEFLSGPKIGDEVIIVSKEQGHQFEIGETVKVVGIEKVENSYKCSNGEDHWWLDRSEFEKI